jgi:hypothetical protein
MGDFTATTVRGAGFRPGVTVLVAGQPATVVSVEPELIEIVVPPSLSVAGPAAVEVIDPSGLSAVRLGGFLYREPLRLALLSPDRSPQQGGVSVELRGTGFMPGLGVRFGGTGSFQVEVTGMERAVAIAPPHAQGLVDVEALLGPQRAVKPRSFLYGTGAVARLPTPPVRDMRVEGVVAYVALGGESDIVGLDAEGHLVTYEQHRRTNGGGLMVADLSEPTVAREVRRLNFSGAGGVRRMAKAGNTLYLAAGSAGLVAVDVSQPANAAVTLTLSVEGEAVDVVTADNLVFVADRSGVKVFRTGETEPPMLVASRPLPGGASALALYGGLLLASNASSTDARLHVLDARRGDLRPLAPEAQLPLSAAARHIAVEGTRAFVSLGRAGQVAIVELADPTAPAPAGTLVLRDELNQGWVSAEQTLVAGDVVWVAGGGGKVQRFVAPVGQAPQWLETASVMGDAKALGRAGRYLMAGTLLLDVAGRPVELPLSDERDAAGVLAGGLVSVALDHLELRGTVPKAGAVVQVGVAPEVLLTALPDMATAGAVRLESAEGAEVRVARQGRADTEGGRITLVPQSPLAVNTNYMLRVGATLADLGGRALGTDVAVRFRTGPSAAPEQPVILAMVPVTGLEAGGDAAVLTGEGFSPGCQVWVGDTLAQGVTVSADGMRLNLIIPPGAAGAAAVRVRNPNGLEALRLGLYRYLVPPELTQVWPDNAPFNSRHRVQLTGRGFAATTQVTFGGRPALHPRFDAQGRISVEVPDDVTGVVEVAVATPTQGGSLVARRPEGFTYTLRPLGSVSGGAEALAVTGRVLLVARAGRLVALDLTRPNDLPEVANVPGVTSAGGLVVAGEEAWLTGQGEVVRYALDGCGAGLPVSCPLQRLERIPLVASGLGSVAAGRGTAYVAVAGGRELVLLGRVGGTTQVVAQVDVGPGVVRDVAMAGTLLAVLVESWPTGRLELRDVADGSLSLVGQVSELPVALRRLAADGTRVAVTSDAGVRLYETADPVVPTLLGRWERSGRSFAVALSGPWALASGDHGLAWMDTTQALQRRTWSSTLGHASQLAVGAGVAVAASGSELRSFELPYPTISSQEPSPGGGLPWGGAVSVTVADRLPPSVLQGTAVELVGSAGEILGTRTVQGSAVLFRPEVALTPGEPVQARVTFGATPYVGGTVLAPWTWPVLPLAEAPALRVDSLVPGHGDVAGGYRVVLTGAGFDEQTQVRFGTQVVPVVPPVAAGTLQVMAPASPLPGPVRVRVSQGNTGAPVDVPGGFVYVAPLTLSRVTPSRVDLNGGLVMVEGSGFNRGLTARVGGLVAPASDFTPTSFKVNVPGGPAGWLDLEVTQAGTPPVTLTHAVLRADSVPPVVTAWEPLDTTGLEQVPLNTVFTLAFSELIDPASATSVRLVREGGTVPEPGEHAVAADARSVTFTPAALLPSTTRFTLSAAGVADVFGNAIAASAASTRTFRSRDVVPPNVYLRLESSTQPLAQGTMLAAEVDWRFRVVATDDSGQLGLSQLWVDGAPVGVSNTGLATYRWPASMRSRSSTLLVRAVDAAGNSADSEVTVQVVEDMPPTVTLTQPAGPVVQVEQGASLTAALSASDNHSLSAVELRLDGVPIKRASGLSGPSATLSHSLYLSAQGTYQLTALAVDNRGQLTTSEAVSVQVLPDSTPPQVTWLTPPTGTRLAGGVSYPLQVSVTDLNGVAQVAFHVDGQLLAVRTAPPWSVDWNVPAVTAAAARVLEARVRDTRGNETRSELSVTVAPPTTQRPSIAITEPASNRTYTEGIALTMSARVTSEVTISSVRLMLGGTEVTLSQPPWQHTFTVPRVAPPSQTIPVRAIAVDRLGRESLPEQFGLTITDDGRQPAAVALTTDPEGAALLGGSSLRVGATDGGVVTGVTVRVSEVSLPAGADGGYTLPLEPEGAPVMVSARVDALDGGWLSLERQGALTAFASAPAVSNTAADDPVVDLATQGAWMLVVRDTGGGHARLELRDAATQALSAERPLDGSAVAVAFNQGRAMVALSASGRGRVEVLAVPSLETVSTLTLRRAPRALEPLPSGLAVGTDEGIELWSSGGLLASRLPLGEVLGLSADGVYLSVLAGDTLHEVDVSVPHAPAVLASVPVEGATGVTALAGARRCVVGTLGRCFRLEEGALTALGETRLPGTALMADGLGPWLLAGTAGGLSVVDAREAPATAGYYPSLAGMAAAGEGRIVSAAPGRVSRLQLRRSMGSPTVQLELPASAAPGARVPVVASVEGVSDPRDGYTAELRVQGTTVQVLKGRLPEYVDLPRNGTAAQVALRVVDLAGHAALAQTTVALEDDGAGPALVQLRTVTEVPSGAFFSLAAVPADPARVASVEYSLEGEAQGSAEAPALGWRLRAPEVSVDTSLTVSAVAVDAQGRRGPSVQSTLWVRAAEGSQAPTVTLARVGSGPILEGTGVRVRATLTPVVTGAEVRFRVDGEEQQRLVLPPYEALLRMPVGTGSRSVAVEAVAVDAQGRESAAALLTLTVVDDLTPPVVTLSVDPAGELLTAGGRVRAVASATDGGELESWSVRALLAGEELASGAGRLDFTVPATTPVGTVLELVATARDVAGNVAVSRVSRTVLAPALPGDGVVVRGSFAGADRLTLRGDFVYATTPAGLAVGRLVRGQNATVEPVGFLATDIAPTALAVRGEWAVLVLPGRGLWVVNVSDPAQPQLRGTLAGSFVNVSAGEDFYAQNSSNATYLLDLAQPSAPALKDGALWPIVEGTSDGLATLVTYWWGPRFLRVKALSSTGSGALDMDAPSLQGEPRLARWTGGRLVVGTDRSVAVLVRQGDSLGLGQELLLPAGVRAMAVANGRAWLAGTDDKLRWVDLRDPGAPQIFATESLSVRALEVSGGLLLATTAEGVLVRRLPSMGASGVALSTPLGSLSLDDAPRTLTPFRRGVLVAAGLVGVQRVSLADPAHPSRVSQVVSGLSLRQVERAGEQIFTLESTTPSVFIEQLNGTVARDSTLSGRLAALGSLERLATSPRRLWAVSGGTVSSVVLPSVQQPASLLLGSATLDVAGDEARAVVALGRAGAAVVQVSAVGTLRQVAAIPDVPTDAVAVEGALAILGGPSGLAVVDISTPNAPIRRASLPTAGAVRRVRLSGRLALVSEGSAGVELWNVSQPEAPVLLGRLPALRAEDAVLSSGQIVVADGLAGVKVFPLPDAAISPAVRVLPGVETVEAGTWLEIAATVTGVQVDTAELLVDGQVVGRMDEGAPRGNHYVSVQAGAGRDLALQVRARTAAGGEALSPLRLVRVSAPATLPPPPSLTLYSPSSGTYHSGDSIWVDTRFSGGLAPVALRARWGGLDLGPLAITSSVAASAYLRLPVVESDTTAPLEVTITDAAGRSLTRSASITVRRVTDAPPSSVSSLPSTLYAGPYIHSFSSSASCPGWCVLRLELDGVTVARQESSGWLNLYSSLVLPENAGGTQATLALVAEDAAGRQARLERTYTVLPDDFVPSVSLYSGPSQASEGSTRTIEASASFQPGHLVRSLRLLANGVEIGSVASTWLSRQYTFPSASAGSTVVLEAVATDHLGRQGRSIATVEIIPDAPPSVSVSASPGPIQGYPVLVCVSASDDVQLTGVILMAGEETLWNCSGNCSGYRCIQSTSRYTGSEILLSANATDNVGHTTTSTQSYAVRENQPPVVSYLETYYSYLLPGTSYYMAASASDEAHVHRLQLRAGGTSIGETVNWHYPSSSLYRSGYYTPTEQGSIVVEAMAEDAAGAQSVLRREMPVLAEGSSSSCNNPVPVGMDLPLRPPLTDLQEAFAGCGESFSSGSWHSLPFDGPVESITLAVQSDYYNWPYPMIAVQDGCGSSVQPVCPGTRHGYAAHVTASSLSAQARVFVHSWYGRVRIASAQLGLGARCIPDSTTVSCSNSICRLQDNGEHRCAPAACNDGLDNDGDGRTDHPAEPGCESIGDNDETDPVPLPTCANGVDEDLDGATDWPADTDCPAASSNGERPNSCSVEPLAVLGSRMQLDFTQASNLENLACAIWSGPDNVLRLEVPGQAMFSGELLNSNTSYHPVSLGLRQSCEAGSSFPACSPADWEYRWIDGEQRYVSFARMNQLVDPGSYLLVADSYYSNYPALLSISGQLLEDQPCDPAQPWFACATGQRCLPSTTGPRCQDAPCADNVDDDGDGASGYPFDPGCESPDDLDEEDPPVAPECANGVDDDADGRVDWLGGDPGCGSRAGQDESGDGEPGYGESCEAPQEVTSSTMVLDFTQATQDESLVCDGRPEADKVMSFRLPAPAMVRITGSPEISALSIRATCAEERGDTACSSLLSGRTSLSIQTGLGWPFPYTVVAKGTGTGTIHIAGTFFSSTSSCDPATPWFACTLPAACVAGPSGASCVTPACANGRDDDGDGLSDYPADPGCTSAIDGDEVDPPATPACRNGVDDDGDGLTDWPLEPGCALRDDEDEADPAVLPQCSNGLDDDGDGQVDRGSDAECISAGSDNEGLLAGTRIQHLPSEPLPSTSFPLGGEGLLTSSCTAGPVPGKVFHWVAPRTGTYQFMGESISLRLPIREGTQEIGCWHYNGPGAPPRVPLRQGDDIIIALLKSWRTYHWLYVSQVYGLDRQPSVVPPLAPPPELPWPESFTGYLPQSLTPWSPPEGATPWQGELQQ